MKNFVLAIALTFALTGCGKARLDTTSDETVKKSMQAVRASLSADEQKEFDENLGQAMIATTMFSGMTGQTPSQVLSPMNGMTGVEMIAISKQKRAEREARERKENEAELAAFEKRLADRAAELELLKRIALSGAHIVETKERFRRNTDLVVTLTNNLDVALKLVAAAYVLKSADRSVPWDEEKELGFAPDGGLEPGETKDVEGLSAISVGYGGFLVLSKAIAEHPDAVLTVVVTGVELADGTRIPASDELSAYEQSVYDTLKKKLESKSSMP